MQQAYLLLHPPDEEEEEEDGNDEEEREEEEKEDGDSDGTIQVRIKGGGGVLDAPGLSAGHSDTSHIRFGDASMMTRSAD